MLSFPNCKLNLGLHITGKRADGYHNLETVFYPLAIKDAVEIISSEEKEPVIFTASGNNINVSSDDNLCVKAFHLLKKDFPDLANVKIHLHKNIPMGAGLGGGSADASAVLVMLNNIFALNITSDKLMNYALQLGSDCPFFIMNKPCFASGRGEVLTPIEIDLSNYKILLVNPGLHVNTGEAFKGLNANNFSAKNELLQIVQTNISIWKNNLKNDFEKPVFEKHPTIAAIKNLMYSNGALYSAMSGTGSSVFGIFEKEKTVQINFPENYFCQIF